MEQCVEIISLSGGADAINACISAYNQDGWTVQQIEAYRTNTWEYVILLFHRSKMDQQTAEETKAPEPMKMRS